MLEIRIATDGNAPIYRQIVEHVRWALATDGHRPGDALPSVRALAEQLLINPNTVAHAYAELVRDGLIEARTGKGYFVAQRRRVYSDEERRRRLEAAVETFAREALLLDFAPDEIRGALDRKLSHAPQGGRVHG